MRFWLKKDVSQPTQWSKIACSADLHYMQNIQAGIIKKSEDLILKCTTGFVIKTTSIMGRRAQGSP